MRRFVALVALTAIAIGVSSTDGAHVRTKLKIRRAPVQRVVRVQSTVTRIQSAKCAGCACGCSITGVCNCP